MIIALVCDMLLRKLNRAFPNSVTRAYADDIALVSGQVSKDAALLMEVFNRFAAVSGLQLNLAKVFVVPLGDSSYEEDRLSIEKRLLPGVVAGTGASLNI